jgi:hypothetical protein
VTANLRNHFFHDSPGARVLHCADAWETLGRLNGITKYIRSSTGTQPRNVLRHRNMPVRRRRRGRSVGLCPEVWEKVYILRLGN